MSMDILQDKIREKKNPTAAGLDPLPEHIPGHILSRHLGEKGETLEALADAYLEWGCALIDALYDIVPAVKPQSAYYELLGHWGILALEKTIGYAKAKGLYVILDAKRNDIGSTAEAYSEAYLGGITIGNTRVSPFDCDALTINAYLGSDGVMPFIETCKREDKSVFALVKTSNPSSGQLQNLMAGDRYFYTAVGDLMERIAGDTIGKYGFSRVGAVVGATYPSDMRALRSRLKNTFFLVPGYGAQGAVAGDVAFAFNENGHGAVINSSRAIMCAWKKTGSDGRDFTDAAIAEAVNMRDELKKHVIIV